MIDLIESKLRCDRSDCGECFWGVFSRTGPGEAGEEEEDRTGVEYEMERIPLDS